MPTLARTRRSATRSTTSSSRYACPAARVLKHHQCTLAHIPAFVLCAVAPELADVGATTAFLMRWALEKGFGICTTCSQPPFAMPGGSALFPDHRHCRRVGRGPPREFTHHHHHHRLAQPLTLAPKRLWCTGPIRREADAARSLCVSALKPNTHLTARKPCRPLTQFRFLCADEGYAATGSINHDSHVASHSHARLLKNRSSLFACLLAHLSSSSFQSLAHADELGKNSIQPAKPE